MINIGVVQGRLSKPIYDKIQEFPFDTWEKEFDLLPKLGLSHIEWIVTKESFDKNPIFTKDLSGYPISAVCCDNFIDISYDNEKYWNLQIQPIIDIVSKWKIPVPVIIPYTEPWQEIPTYNFKLRPNANSIMLETNIPQPYKTYRLSFDCVYDTGNVTASNITHKQFIDEAGSTIKMIHLKDRLKNNGITVAPLTGDTEFKQIFNLLSYFHLKKEKLVWTLQTARGLTGLEQETVYYHKLIFEKLINEYFL